MYHKLKKGSILEAAATGVLQKKLFLNILQYSQEKKLC